MLDLSMDAQVHVETKALLGLIFVGWASMGIDYQQSFIRRQ